MAKAAGFTIYIDGDISGLTEAINDAQKKIDTLSGYAESGILYDFTKQKQQYNFLTKSGNINLDEQIRHWQSMAEAYSFDTSAVLESQAKIYELERKKAELYNGIAEEFIKKNDFFSGDSDSSGAVKVFEQIKELNRYFAQNGILSQSEYYTNTENIGSVMYEGRMKASEDWLKHEEKYNELSIEDYVSGLDRMKQYTDEYFSAGLIDYKEYIEGREHIYDETVKKNRQSYDKWKNDAQTWYSDRSLYGDWEQKGDSSLEYYTRVTERINEFYESGKISFSEMNTELAEAQRELFKLQSQGDEVYQKWKSDADGWKKSRDTYGDWEAYGDSIVEFYGRCIGKVRELYEEGHISWQKYMDETSQYQLELFSQKSLSADGILKEMSSYMNKLRDQYRTEESELQNSWKSADRRESLADVNRLIQIYENSVTEHGREKYKDLLETRKKLMREEQLYNLQLSHNSTLEELQRQYDKAESKKNRLLNLIEESGSSIESITGAFGVNFTLFGTRTEKLINELINEVKNAKRRISSAPSYSDNRTISIATGTNTSQMIKLINGTYCTIGGPGTFVFGGGKV